MIDDLHEYYADLDWYPNGQIYVPWSEWEGLWLPTHLHPPEQPFEFNTVWLDEQYFKGRIGEVRFGSAHAQLSGRCFVVHPETWESIPIDERAICEPYETRSR